MLRLPNRAPVRGGLIEMNPFSHTYSVTALPVVMLLQSGRGQDAISQKDQRTRPLGGRRLRVRDFRVVINLQVPEAPAHQLGEGTLVLGVAAHGLADRERPSAARHQIDIADEAVQPARKQRDAILWRQAGLAGRFGREPAADEVHVPYVRREKPEKTI